MEQEKEREGAHLREMFNLLHPYIRTHILHNIPYTFPKLFTQGLFQTTVLHKHCASGFHFKRVDLID